MMGVLPLSRILQEYVSYFNQARPHPGITQRMPAPRVSPPGEPKAGRLMAFPVLNGLHHDYRRAAALGGVGRKSGRMNGVANTAAPRFAADTRLISPSLAGELLPEDSVTKLLQSDGLNQ